LRVHHARHECSASALRVLYGGGRLAARMGARAERTEAREPAPEPTGPSACILHTTGPSPREESTRRLPPERTSALRAGGLARAIPEREDSDRVPRLTRDTFEGRVHKTSRRRFVTGASQAELEPTRYASDVERDLSFVAVVRGHGVAVQRTREPPRTPHGGMKLEANGCGGPIRTSLSGRLSRRRNPSYYPAENARFRRLRAKHKTLRPERKGSSQEPRTRERRGIPGRRGRPGRPGKTFWMEQVGIEKPSTSGVRVTRPKKEHATTHTLLPDGPLVKSAPFRRASDGPFQLARSGASWPLSATYSEYPPP
jgi:hypothetical protein